MDKSANAVLEAVISGNGKATEEAPPPNPEIDGITANGENAFTSKRLGIALVIKPELTAGDLDKWLGDFEVVINRSSIVDRVKLFFAAVRAGIIMHCTDKPTLATMTAIEGRRAEWYGAQLTRIYNRYNSIDPN